MCIFTFEWYCAWHKKLSPDLLSNKYLDLCFLFCFFMFHLFLKSITEQVFLCYPIFHLLSPCMTSSSSSSSTSDSLVIFPSAFMIMVLLLGQIEAICLMPKYLKHFVFLVLVLDNEVELCLVSTLETVDFPWGLDELPTSFLDLLVRF